MVITANRINRRHLFGMVAAGTVAGSALRASAQTDSTNSTEQYLIAGVPGGFGSIMGGIEVYGADLQQLGSLAIEDGVVGFEPTGRSGLVMMHSLFGAVIADFQTGDLAQIAWDTDDPGLLLPVQNLGAQPLNPDYLIVQNAALDRVYVIDLASLTGTDITSYVANESVDMIWAVPDLPEQGSRGGIWTGERVYAIDFADPASARTLVGDDPDWYSTTLNLSSDGTWGIYTTYDPGQGGEVAHIYLENLESGEQEQIGEGNVWCSGTFVRSDPDRFVAFTPDGIEVRRLSDPTETEKTVGNASVLNGRWHWLLSGSVLLYGSAEDNDSPLEWMLIDAKTWEVVPLPDLAGLVPTWPKLATPSPEHLLFVKDVWDETSGPVVGLDIARGETWIVIEDAFASAYEGITASQDGRFHTVNTQETNPDVWFIDMEARSVQLLDGQDGMVPYNAAVSPDGTILTIQCENVRANEQSLFWASTDSPDDRTRLTDAILLGWC